MLDADKEEEGDMTRKAENVPFHMITQVEARQKDDSIDPMEMSFKPMAAAELTLDARSPGLDSGDLRESDSFDDRSSGQAEEEKFVQEVAIMSENQCLTPHENDKTVEVAEAVELPDSDRAGEHALS